MNIFTLGFTKKTAEQFFTKLRQAGLRRLIDVRLNNVSQLSGFAKRDDLRFFAKELCGIEYIHMPKLAPTKGILDQYRKGLDTWTSYEKNFLELIAERKIEQTDMSLFDGACLLCSEETPHHCHRRLVAEYLKNKWSSINIHHL